MNTIDHSRNSKNSASDTFDHVLIDMNQLLHITLRRSRTEGHALTLMIQELDQCMDVASPTKSVVLAFDGPPAAAKLATQRTRRYGTVMRAERKKARKELLRQRGIIPVSDYASSSSKSKAKRKRGKRKNKEEKEEETLKITPGTEFMDRAHDAVLYWAWQRLENPRGKLSKCRIYISPSNVPGEGEVKLLDWLIQAGNDDDKRPAAAVKRKSSSKTTTTRNKSSRIVKTGDSVAILGGDSDLVLEGLVIPPSITHNVFVILPSVGGTSYVVSLWETTLALGRFLAPHFDPKDCMFVRTDLVLLLIMNGNDYLPKLRGSAGFNKLFHTYLRLLKTWLKENDNERPYLIDPNTLEFNIPFCIAFFQTLANVAPKQLSQPSETLPYSRSITPLSHLHSLVDAGFLPQPAVFSRLTSKSSSRGDSDEEVLRLTLGEDGPDLQMLKFDIAHSICETPLKKTKQTLANKALEELLGEDYMDLNDYGDGGSDGEDDSDDESSLGGYSWEINLPALSSVDEYLKGLMWNLSTYQDGVCSDYNYNYGRRMSPTADEVVTFFKKAQKKGRAVSRAELLNDEIGSPLSAGLVCLAALPSQVDDLIPEPYKMLSKNGKIEDIYGECMDPENNVFNMELFEELCHNEIGEIKVSKTVRSKEYEKRSRGRKVRLGDSFWTVLRRAPSPLDRVFSPPPPYSDRLSFLRYDSRIQSTYITATEKPRWLQNESVSSRKEIVHSERHSEMGGLLAGSIGDNTSLEDVGYKIVYQSGRSKKANDRTPQRKAKIKTKEEVDTLQSELSRMKKIGINPPTRKVLCNNEDFNAISCLQQLHDAGLLRALKWNSQCPSDSKYALLNPSVYEEVTLFIRIGDGKHRLKLDRNTLIFSRRSIKHHLATDAMNKIFTKRDWTKMKMQEMKHYLVSPPLKEGERNRNHNHNRAEEFSALQCIHELRDARCINVNWEFAVCTEYESTEIIRLYISGEDLNLTFEEARQINKQSKSSMKRRLAALAMDHLIQDDNKDWKSMTISEMKFLI